MGFAPRRPGVGSLSGVVFGGAPQPVLDAIDGFVRGGSPGGQANAVVGRKPIRGEVRGRLDVMDPWAMPGTGGHEFAGVVAVGAADHHDHVALAGQGRGGGLPVLGGLADGVAADDFRGGKAGPEAIDEGADALGRLGGLGHDAESRPGRERIDVGLGEHDVAVGVILGEAPDLDMVSLAHDDGVEAIADEGVEGGMGAVDEGAGGLGDLEAQTGELVEASAGGPVGGDQDPLGGDVAVVVPGEDAVAAEILEDGGVVDEFAEGGDGAAGSLGFCELDGVADAETPAEMGSALDLHGIAL